MVPKLLCLSNNSIWTGRLGNNQWIIGNDQIIPIFRRQQAEGQNNPLQKTVYDKHFLTNKFFSMLILGLIKKSHYHLPVSTPISVTNKRPKNKKTKKCPTLGIFVVWLHWKSPSVILLQYKKWPLWIIIIYDNSAVNITVG